MSVYGNNLYARRKLEFLDEAYIGKTPTLLEIEKHFNAFRSKEMNFYGNLSTDSDIIAINRLFEKQFGMDIFALGIDKTKIPNAYTYVLASNFDIQRQEDLSQCVTGSMDAGFRFKEGNDFCIVVNISYGILADPKYTDAEIVAILLHEIGHNFADCLYDEIRFANKEMYAAYENWLISLATLKGFIFALPLYRFAKKMLRDNTNTTKRINSKKKPTWLAGLISGLKGKHKDHQSIKREIKARKKRGKGAQAYKRNAGTYGKTKAKGSISRQNEVFADKFAGVYGYGPELGSGLVKLEYSETEEVKKLEEKSKKFKEASREFDEAVRDINDYDCHPQLIQRIIEELKLLRREYEKIDIDPKVKEVIKAQIDELEALLKEITSVSKDFSKDEDAQNAYNEYVKEHLPDAVSDEIEAAIEESLDKLLDEDKQKRKKK
jgi:hypothetical protein